MKDFCVRSIISYPGESHEVGFCNLGSSCYSNAVLVALSHCQAVTTATCASELPFCKLFSGAATMDRRFNTIIPRFVNKFSPRVQEDAGEYLISLIDILSRDPRVKEVFNGKTATHQHCPACNYHSKTCEDFTVLPVSISEIGWDGNAPNCPSMARSYGRSGLFDVSKEASFGHSVVSLLQHGSVSKLSLEASLGNMCTACKITCSECKSDDALLYVNIEQLPEVLIVQINRFGKRWFGLGKVYRMVSFPDLDVDFSHFVEEEIDCGPSKYSLTAVVFHAGFMNVGHYQCYAKRQNIWYLFNDDKVTRVDREEVVTSQAYLLFYTKNETPDVSRVRRNLANVSGKMDVDFGIDVHVFSNPKQWIGKIPHGSYDEAFAEASELAGHDLFKDPDYQSIVGNFMTKMSWCENVTTMSITEVNTVWACLTHQHISDIRHDDTDEVMEVGAVVKDLYTTHLEFLKASVQSEAPEASEKEIEFNENTEPDQEETEEHVMKCESAENESEE